MSKFFNETISGMYNLVGRFCFNGRPRMVRTHRAIDPRFEHWKVIISNGKIPWFIVCYTLSHSSQYTLEWLWHVNQPRNYIKRLFEFSFSQCYVRLQHFFSVCLFNCLFCFVWLFFGLTNRPTFTRGRGLSL